MISVLRALGGSYKNNLSTRILFYFARLIGVNFKIYIFFDFYILATPSTIKYRHFIAYTNFQQSPKPEICQYTFHNSNLLELQVHGVILKQKKLQYIIPSTDHWLLSRFFYINYHFLRFCLVHSK